MTKYSTGRSGGSGGGGACELCGKPHDDLSTASVAGAELEVCPDCAPHDDGGGAGRGGGGGGEARDRKRRAAQNLARATDSYDGDSTHWEEEGTDYADDPLPYLVSDYDDRVTEARQDAGLQLPELADELGIPEADLLAVEQGRANRANVSGSVIEALEERLDVELADE